MKKLLLSCLLAVGTLNAFAQIDTLKFPKERKEINALLHDPTFKIQTQNDCNDFVSVGPKGDINYSLTQWRNSQGKEKLIFKSVKVVPGSEIVRIYDRTTAVVNWLADVQLNVQGHDIALKVRRLEVFIKKDGSWCMVAGQGTQVDEQLFPIKVK
jgi:hypothetical protein